MQGDSINWWGGDKKPIFRVTKDVNSQFIEKEIQLANKCGRQ